MDEAKQHSNRGVQRGNWQKNRLRFGGAIVGFVALLGLLQIGGCFFPEKEKEWKSQFRMETARMFPKAFFEFYEGYGFRDHIGERLPKRVVVLIHGLDDPGKIWRSLHPALEKEGYVTLEFRYPNDQPIRNSSYFLASRINQLRDFGAEEVILVGHSMGGLVCRELLTNPDIGYQSWVQKGVYPEVKGLIMLGTPNSGSELARFRVFTEIRDQWVHFVNGEGSLLRGIFDGAGEAKIDLLPESEFLNELNGRVLSTNVPVAIVGGMVSPYRTNHVRERVTAWQNELPEDRKGLVEDVRSGLERLCDGVGDGCVSLDSLALPGVTNVTIVSGTHLSMIRNVIESSERAPPGVEVVLSQVQEWYGKGLTEGRVGLEQN